MMLFLSICWLLRDSFVYKSELFPFFQRHSKTKHLLPKLTLLCKIKELEVLFSFVVLNQYKTILFKNKENYCLHHFFNILFSRWIIITSCLTLI